MRSRLREMKIEAAKRAEQQGEGEEGREEEAQEIETTVVHVHVHVHVPMLYSVLSVCVYVCVCACACVCLSVYCRICVELYGRVYAVISSPNYSLSLSLYLSIYLYTMYIYLSIYSITLSSPLSHFLPPPPYLSRPLQRGGQSLLPMATVSLAIVAAAARGRVRERGGVDD